MDLLTKWKKNIQEIKWKTVNHNRREFSNSFLDKKVSILKNFFHPLDLIAPNSNDGFEYSLVDPSSIWLVYLLSQKNLGSFELIISICDIIEYFSVRNSTYLKSKLLQKNGRINKKSFRNDFFEVWVNYTLLQKGIEVDLIKCYRNEYNNNEGYDSIFNYSGQSYVIECVKLKSWGEEVLALTHSMINKMYRQLAKLSKSAKVHFETLYVYAKPSISMNNGGNEFSNHLRNYFEVIAENTENRTYRSHSKGFSKIAIFSRAESLFLQSEKEYQSKNYTIKLQCNFIDYNVVDDSGLIIYDVGNQKGNEKFNYRIKAETKYTRSPSDFEEHLIKKAKKKINQHSKESANRHLILAIELEKFNGLNNFPIETIENFDHLKSKIDSRRSILIFYKNSQKNKLEIKSQAIYDRNNKFMKYVSS